MTKKLPPPFVYDVRKRVAVVCLCSESSLHNKYNIKKRLPTLRFQIMRADKSPLPPPLCLYLWLRSIQP